MTSTEFAYKKTVEKPRTTPLARLFVWVGTHAVLSGFLGGVCVVLIAMATAFEGVKKAPTEAMILSAIVVLVWTVLVGLMGSFFRRQGVMRLEVHRAIRAGDELFRWRENADVLLEIEAPNYEILAADLPEFPSDSAPDLSSNKGQLDKLATVFLRVSGKGGSFVLETQTSTAEALQYKRVPGDEKMAVDEALPVALASRVMLYAERKAV